jgi:MFS family permease
MQSPTSQAIPSTPYNMRYVWAISLVAALGGLMFGYDWIVIGGTKPFYERFFQVATAWQEGWAMGSALIGCLIGAIISGSLSDRFGRKRLLILAGFVFVLSSLGTALVDSFTAFNFWRIAGGMAIGLASNLSPMYIAEVAPAAVRGRLVAMNQFTIVIGILVAQAANYGIAQFGSIADGQAVEKAAARAKSLDAAQVAGELAWQVKCKDREKLVSEFTALAGKRSAALDYGGVCDIVKQMNETRKKKDKINADDELAVKVVGYGLTSHNVTRGWRWMFGVTAIPACFFFVLLFFVPESPRWLVKNGKSSLARSILARIGGDGYAQQEVGSIEATLVGEIEKVNFKDLLAPKVRRILTIGITLAILQQWCGINVIFYYAADLFRKAGYTVSGALLNIVIIGAVNLLFTIVAINSVDRFGRRILMLIGFAGLAVILGLIGASYYTGQGGLYLLVLTLLAIGVYAFSLAPVVWVVLSEIFPNRIRGAAMSASVFALWSACFILTDTFPLLTESESIGEAGTFWIYAAICAVGFLFTLRFLPETKGKTLEEIEKELVD